MAAGDRWTEDELRACVEAFVAMWKEQQAGGTPIKSEFVQRLLKGALRNRTKGSVEYRLMNISSVMEKSGKQFLLGYVPAHGVGPTNEKVIRSMLVSEGVL